MLALVQTAAENSTQGWTVLFNYGALGVCLVALAIYFKFKDKNYERRIDEMREMEKAFRKEQAEQQERFRKEQAELLEKYRVAIQQMTSTLEFLTDVIKKGE
jgi:ABC-type Fe3+-citrate transport system substrate-binding protein